MTTRRKQLTRIFLAAAGFILLCSQPSGQSASAPSTPAPAGLASILHYINSDWDALTRSMAQCDSVIDPKLPEASVLYLPADLTEPDSVKKLQQSCRVKVEHLPILIHRPGQPDVESIQPPGLLFLPDPYVVPGGRFNEMYGWDSYFIVVGLVRAGRLELARNMVENFFFEIEHYGTVLNANRTYYLTRSQPPFLTSMIMEVYSAEKNSGRDNKTWLARAYDFAARDYEMWVHDLHLAGATGLSRYYDFGNGPAPEALQGESGIYRNSSAYFLLRPELARAYILRQDAKQATPARGSEYQVQVCDTAGPGCETAGNIRLSDDYYKGDRSMRESGFDISFRFGPYGAATHHFAPVCLNSLLYKTETDLETMSRVLSKTAEAESWKNRAAQRKQRIDQYLWDDQRGMYFDYNFETGNRSTYEYATTFYPLWAGLASAQQAAAVERNLKAFERPGGLATSSRDTGVQWDYPYGWAPLQMLAVDGLRRYGFNSDADRLSYRFLSMVAENFRREGTIREKYNVVTRSSEAHVTAGYQANVIGFGWTNATFLEFLQELPKEIVDRLAREQEVKSPPAKASIAVQGR